MTQPSYSRTGFTTAIWIALVLVIAAIGFTALAMLAAYLIE